MDGLFESRMEQIDYVLVDLKWIQHTFVTCSQNHEQRVCLNYQLFQILDIL